MPPPSPPRWPRCSAPASSARVTDRPAPPKGRLSCVVHGQVQGVGFRWFVRENARRLDVFGTVQNRADGSVEVHASGAETSLARLRTLLFEGPPGAVVERLDDVPWSSSTFSDSFTIIR